jgi:Dolichyl-phosphate-mannose-protein mannosyltransferase
MFGSSAVPAFAKIAPNGARRVQELTAWLAMVLPLVFLVLGAQRAYPFVDDVTLPAVHPDDWHTYKALAISVLRGGPSMPGVPFTYTGLPHGFLYVYFLALAFAAAGVNAAYVYVIQSFAVGLSVSLTYLAIRRHLTAWGGLACLLALTVLLYVDVFRHLSFKLLSENLYFLLSPLLFIFLFRSVDGSGHEIRDSIIAGALFGLVVLTRPSFIGSVPAVIAVLCINAAVKRRSPWPVAALSVSFGVVVSAVAVRNYAAAGHATFDLVTDTFDWLRLWNLPFREAAAALVARILFVIGFPESLAPAYHLRLHWTVLWLLWLLYPLRKLRGDHRFEVWEWLAYAYVLGYIGPVLLISGDIGSYGGRMIVVLLPLLVVAAFRLAFSVDDAGSAQFVDEARVAHVWH